MQLLEFLPILVFVIVYYAFGIYYATAALMLAAVLEVVFLWATKRTISTQLKFTLWLSLVFGGLTLLLHDKTFIQWKPTILNWAMAAALLGSQFFAGRNLIERMLGSQMSLPSSVWSRLNVGWSLGFFVAGALNLYVARNFSEAFWVNYKLIGGFGITLLYVLISVAYLLVGGHMNEAGQSPSNQIGKSS
jgi:intracellular septation protein